MSAVWRHITAEGYAHDRFLQHDEAIPFGVGDLLSDSANVDHVTIDFTDGGRTVLARVASAAEGVARLAKLDVPERQCGECGGVCEIRHSDWCNEGNREEVAAIIKDPREGF